ncbi:hypothetical protein BKA70DRAFT_1279200 [Coprinopsis sp. MPI-PUGE-AT-0042]|nr:hypothetical protein BKA70DRAFT_1279200 [Coprinopsis sp. MPI-PUGE-AT-0042]
MNPDPRLHDYIISNDPLPEKLRPALSCHVAQLDHRISEMDHQLKSIEGQILDRKAQLDALQNEIEALTRTQKGLSLQRVQLQAKKIRYEQTLSPLRRVPPEVIAKILAFALQTRYGCLNIFERQQFRDYRHVSKLWRATSLSTPSLWRGIHIDQGDFEGLRPWDGQEVEIRQRFARYITLWFSHAGQGACLRLAVSAIWGLKAAHILEAIRESTFCISFLVLEARDNPRHFQRYADLAVLSNGPHSYPALNSLIISLPKRLDMDGEEGHTFDLTQSFPSLRAFTLNGAKGTHVPVNFAHQTLQHLHLTFFTYSPFQFSCLIHNLPNLSTLQLYKCTAEVEASEEDWDIEPYVHQKLRSITFFSSVPVEWFEALTCSSLETIHVDGNFGFAGNCSDAGKRLSDLILDSLPSQISVVALAVHQEPMLRELLSTYSSIQALEMRRFSDLDPMTFMVEDKDEEEVDTPSQPFLIPSSLKNVTCREQTTPKAFWFWVDNIRRCLRPGQTLRIQAPECFKGIYVLDHHIPSMEVAGSLIFHNYMYQANALCRHGKFTFNFYPRKLSMAPRSHRLAGARLAFRRHLIRMFAKVELRGGRRKGERRCAIFSVPTVS